MADQPVLLIEILVYQGLPVRVVMVVVVVLFFVLFQNDAANFVGTWDIEYLSGSSNPTGEWTFYNDGTLKIEQGSSDIWNDYEIINGKICLSSSEYSYYHCYDYEFTNGGTSLTLSADGTTSVELKK